MSGHPIRAVARMTGLSIDTLRAWERRYQAVVPTRGARGRVYSALQVERLQHLAALVGEGHAIGAIAALPDAALRGLRRAATPRPPTAEPAIDLESLLAAVKGFDLAAVDALLNRYVLVLPPATVIFHVILPLLRTLGERWERGVVRPAHEHLASGVIRGVLSTLLRALARPAADSRIVFATPPGERHELGLLCGAVLAASAGHAVIFLGPDLPCSDIVHGVRTSRAAMLVLAATTADAAAVRQMRPLARLPARVAIVAGGPRAEALRAAVGPRVRVVSGLEALAHVFEHGAR